MDVKELPSGPIVLAIDIPGVSLSDVKVQVEEGNVLAISRKRSFNFSRIVATQRNIHALHNCIASAAPTASVAAKGMYRRISS